MNYEPGLGGAGGELQMLRNENLIFSKALLWKPVFLAFASETFYYMSENTGFKTQSVKKWRHFEGFFSHIIYEDIRGGDECTIDQEPFWCRKW